MSGVFGYADEGHSCRAAAAYFRNGFFVVNLVKAFRVREALPQAHGGRRHTCFEPHRAFLLQKVAEKADITMPELAAELAAATCQKIRSRLAFALAHPHYRFQKNSAGQRA